MHRENDLPYLSPEGRGRANKVSEGEGVRKLGIFSCARAPSPRPLPSGERESDASREENFLMRRMDHRVKPGGDEEERRNDGRIIR
jgi:hypothetical protein